ncbi:hypothetical protein [Streptomyces sp. NPDC018031]|uniref:hypothetical protein n=1 Tax=Streptomyces sp. NPDC018031 TaxID=3365033 RepID=UPI0037AFEA20
MRLPSAPAVCGAVVLATAVSVVPARAAPPAAPDRDRAGGAAYAPAPVCGDRGSPDLPLRAELDEGPSRFPRGGYWRAWHLKVANTTRAACRAIHPVVVLTDRNRALRPAHIRFEFYDERADRWRPVRFETTDEDENVGVFAGKGFAGFTVPAGRTVTTALRSRFTGDAPIGPVTASVTTVQRRADDGDWVGQSADVSFRITARSGPERDADGGPGDGRDRDDPDADDPGSGGQEPGSDPGDGPSGGPDRGTPDGDAPDGGGPDGDRATGAGRDGLPGSDPFPPPALADTGRAERTDRGSLLPLTLAGVGFLIGGSALMAVARAVRRR